METTSNAHAMLGEPYGAMDATTNAPELNQAGGDEGASQLLAHVSRAAL